jgi:hypothetical protein
MGLFGMELYEVILVTLLIAGITLKDFINFYVFRRKRVLALPYNKRTPLLQNR